MALTKPQLPEKVKGNRKLEGSEIAKDGTKTENAASSPEMKPTMRSPPSVIVTVEHPVDEDEQKTTMSNNDSTDDTTTPTKIRLVDVYRQTIVETDAQNYTADRLNALKTRLDAMAVTPPKISRNRQKLQRLTPSTQKHIAMVRNFAVTQLGLTLLMTAASVVTVAYCVSQHNVNLSFLFAIIPLISSLLALSAVRNPTHTRWLAVEWAQLLCCGAAIAAAGVSLHGTICVHQRECKVTKAMRAAFSCQDVERDQIDTLIIIHTAANVIAFVAAALLFFAGSIECIMTRKTWRRIENEIGDWVGSESALPAFPVDEEASNIGVRQAMQRSIMPPINDTKLAPRTPALQPSDNPPTSSEVQMLSNESIVPPQSSTKKQQQSNAMESAALSSDDTTAGGTLSSVATTDDCSAVESTAVESSSSHAVNK